MTEKKLTHQQEAPRKHGMYAIDGRGEAAVTDPRLIARLRDLRQLARAHEGRQELREELLSRVLLICEIGFSEVQKTVERGESIWDVPPIKRLATYIAEARRLLDSFPKGDEKVVDALTVLDDIRKVVDEHKTED